MIKQEETREKEWYEVEKGKSYELRWLEAERALAILEYENYIRLRKQLKEVE